MLIRVADYDDDSAYVSDPLNPIYWSTGITFQDLLDAGYLGTTELPWRLKPATIIEPGYATYDAKTLSYMSNVSSPDRVLTTILPAGEGTDFNSNGGFYIQLNLYLLSQSDDDQYIELDAGNTSITASNAYTPLNAVANSTRLSMWLGTNAALVFGNDVDYAYDFTGTVAEMNTSPDDNSTLSVS